MGLYFNGLGRMLRNFYLGMNFPAMESVTLVAIKLWLCPRLHYQMGVTGFDSGLRACV